MKYVIDTKGGNSGSPVEQECRELVYAIHTNGFCETEEEVNKGTAITNQALQNALANPQGVCADCNRNGVHDDLDISGGTSNDCNSNGIPDECEPIEDCQPNGTQDICDIADSSQDLNGNLVPDECESPVGACCRGDGSCAVELDSCCDAVGGTFQGAGTSCSPERTCCVGDGSCVTTSPTCCANIGGESQPKPTPACVAGTGACCLPPFGCCVENVDQGWCMTAQGDYFANQTCAETLCPGTMGPAPGP